MSNRVPGLTLPSKIVNFIVNRIAVAVVASAVVGTFLVSLAAFAGLVPVAFAAVVGLILTLGLCLILGRALLGANGRRIVEASLWYAEQERRHWRERTGTARVPRTQGGTRRWLAENPATERNRSERIQAWLLAGDLDAARAEQRTRPAESPTQRVEATLDEWLIEVWIGGSAPYEVGDALVSQVMDEPLRRRVMRELLMLRAMESAQRGDPWRPHMLELRNTIGAAADGYLWRRFWPLVLAWTAVAYAVGTGIGGFVTGSPE